MQRRTLLKTAAFTAAAASLDPFGFAQSRKPEVTRVLLIAKCHLDVGFTMTQQKVIRQYFDVYYPAAMKTTAALRAAGDDRYTWSTGSWLLYEYLEQATPEQRRTMEQAITNGDIAWHALPFSWQTEMLDRSMIEGALSLSHTLDQRFGRKTIAAKMTDVPGHSRGIIAPLSSAGIRLLDIGVNAASTPPDVPDFFLWKDSSGSTLAVMYHRMDYGGVMQVPGTSTAIAVMVSNDNSGPHSLEEISTMYADLRRQFPGATIQAATFSDAAAAVEPIRSQLPVITQEIGDTWIYGCASDPTKVARYRELARLRRRWIDQHHFAVGDATDQQLLRRLLLAAEHTWGTDTKSYVDNNHYRPADLLQVIHTPPYQTMEFSWQEKRDNITHAVATLPGDLQQQADTAFGKLIPVAPSSEGLTAYDVSKRCTTTHFEIALDPNSGAIIHLKNRRTGRAWASATTPLALLTYQTLSAEDYTAYRAGYVHSQADWAPRDFGKPNIEAFHAVAREWHPKLTRCLHAHSSEEDRLLLELSFAADPSTVANTAFPQQIFVDLHFPASEACIDLQCTTIAKPVSRMPEALWLTFQPAVSQPAWVLDKVNHPVVTTDVLSGGGRAMHAISDNISCTDDQQTLRIQSLDAPIVALGERSPLNFTKALPDLSRGLHFSLFNNAWGTNYIQWAGGDWSYRFSLSA